MITKVCKTTEWTDREWETYVIGYNEVFGTDETIADFKNKYFSAYKGYSLHSLLVSNDSFLTDWLSMFLSGSLSEQIL